MGSFAPFLKFCRNTEYTLLVSVWDGSAAAHLVLVTGCWWLVSGAAPLQPEGGRVQKDLDLGPPFSISVSYSVSIV